MKTATIYLAQSKFGSNVLLKEVTPLEAILLTAEHHQNVGKEPVTVDESSITEIERDDFEEAQRLRAKYGNKKVEAVLGKLLNKFPKDYSMTKLGMQFTLNGNRMSEFTDFKVA